MFKDFDVPELCLDWIIPGKLAALALPDEEQLEHLARLGIKVLISLNEVPPRTFTVSRLGMEHITIPVPNYRAPTQEQIERFVAVVRDRLARNLPVAVHCLAGVGRTGTMLACYFVAEGMRPEQAIRHVRRHRPGAVETDEQERAIWEYWARLQQDK